jgi:flavin reductase (DIM6/NTAB) family NADH-FMN oxidoreductase RutF
MSNSMTTIVPGDIPHKDLHQILLSGVAPRPIALVSTISQNGICNLSPYSFYNSFASKPPIIAIGPAISAATGKIKDTYTNIIETGECTVNAVTFSMTEQISLASCEYESSIDEFVKCGLHKQDSLFVKAPRVKESPFQMECIFLETKELGRDIGGNGNIMLLEVKHIHISNDVIVDGNIDPVKLDLIARMGYDFYCRADAMSIYQVHKPKWNGIGFDILPEDVLTSEVLSASDIAILAGVKEMPHVSNEYQYRALDFLASSDESYKEINLGLIFDSALNAVRHNGIKRLLKKGLIYEAWSLVKR